MRMKIILAATAAASAILLTVSCTKQELPETNAISKTFTAVINQGTTRTTIDSDYKVSWSSGDEININGAIYSATPDESDATKASFTYVSGTTPEAEYIAFYPASIVQGELKHVLPEIQTYEPGKFVAPMFASSDTESLDFNNLCSVLCFSLKGAAKVGNITVTAKEAVRGRFAIVPPLSLTLFDNLGYTVTLDCGSGVQLDSSTATNFYIYLPPQTYSAGMKIVITDTDGGTFTKSTTSEVVLKRNELYTLNWNPEFTPAGSLPGKFSVASGKQVYFSKGNLIATVNASGIPTEWKFATNQYDFLGEGGANKTIGSTAGDVDLFCWSTEATNNNWGIHTKTAATEGYTDGEFKDWGKNVISGTPAETWRTPTAAEWRYLINVDDEETVRKGKYKFPVTVCGKENCLIIAPDNWDTSTNQLQMEYSATSTPMTWEQAQAAGLVCLPFAGYRLGSNCDDSDFGLYWSSSSNDYGYVHRVYLYFRDSEIYPASTGDSYYGSSVRLITDVE